MTRVMANTELAQRKPNIFNSRLVFLIGALEILQTGKRARYWFEIELRWIPFHFGKGNFEQFHISIIFSRRKQ